MKFIQTLYFDKKLNPFENALGWLSPEYHLMAWALSALQLKKNYNKVELFASTKAAELLIDLLNLPYDEVHITHDDFFIPDPELWALSKIRTYSLQEDPFIHIDGDAFIFSELPSKFSESELIAQNLEEATIYTTSTQNDLMEHFTFFPDCVAIDFNSGMPITSINAGIIGGNNCSFFKDFSAKAVQYVKRNLNHLPKINKIKFNMLFEQHLFYSMAVEREIRIDFLLDNLVKDNEYNGLSDFHEVPLRGNFVHLLGHYKQNEFTCMQLAGILRKLYPEYYYKIIDCCKRHKVPMVCNYYNQTNFNNYAHYREFTLCSKDQYDEGLIKNTNAIEDPFITHNVGTSALIVLTDFIANLEEVDKKQAEVDFGEFFAAVQNNIDLYKSMSSSYLYGRDLRSIEWYEKLFEDEFELLKCPIIRCPEVSVIQTVFDWSRIIQSFKSIGREYYKTIDFIPGKFFHLIAPELLVGGFNVFDIDELEMIILDHLKTSKYVEELLVELHLYVDDCILNDHIQEFNGLIFVFLKQLVLKKAIKPVLNRDRLERVLN